VNIFLNDLLCLAESSADAPFSASNRIVIKRPSAHESWRTLVNYDAVIERCERKGFQTVDPASLTFPQQVRLFNQCDLLVSEFNSASHNSIFMPFGSSKVLLNWTNHYESSIAALRHQQMHMVLPRDGEPRLFRNRHQQPAEYEICMEEFESELDRALERSAGDAASLHDAAPSFGKGRYRASTR
jgi:capsular polysaccharide biosynthesis protein